MSYRYTFDGRTVEMAPAPGLIAIRNFQRSYDTTFYIGSVSADSNLMGLEILGEDLTIVQVPAPFWEAEAREKTVFGNPALKVGVRPVFRIGKNYVVAPDRIIVGIVSAALVADLVRKYDAELLQSDDRQMLLRLPEGQDPFALAAAIENEPGVRYAEPDFVTIGSILPVPSPTEPVAADELFARQYALRITKTIEAWEVVTGNSDVRVAVLDVGVQKTHPDLETAVVDVHDAIVNATSPQPNSWDWHGTACAGLVAAVANRLGIRGVASGVSLLAVRIAQSLHSRAPWQHTNSEIRAGIKWAWENGADVLTISWGESSLSSAVKEELDAARTFGRRGLGCVVVAAAGNSYAPVAFPASLPGVLAVSASNEQDEPKTPQSPDGESWGTNHGPEIDVAAPGIHNVTTDISGGGYGNDDYITNFGGTSSAAPIVAGACALIISANPSLSESEVRQIITSTAEKVGPFPYPNGRNDFFGSGRLNVLDAVKRASEMARLSTSIQGSEDGLPNPV